MSDSEKLIRSLDDAQRKHHKLLARVERTAAQLERRKAKLLKLESLIAGFERHVSEPHKQHVGPPDDKATEGLKRAQLIFNPSSGNDDSDSAMRLAHIVATLRAHGIWAHIGIKTSGKAARAMARDAVQKGWPLVVVASGDGTIEEVASELVNSPTVLGIVPIGTMNNLARSLGIPLDVEDACALIGMGTVRHIDMGRVVANDSPHAEYFVECGGIGLGALATLAGQAFEKRKWGVLSGALTRAVIAGTHPVKVEMDDVTLEPSTSIITVANAPMMGHNLLVAPDARMDDGLLDVAVYDGMGDAELIKHLKGIASGNGERVPSYRTRRVCVTSEEMLSVNADKESQPKRSVIEFEIVPGALTVIVGNGIGLSVPVEAAPGASAPSEGASNGNGRAKSKKEPETEEA